MKSNQWIRCKECNPGTKNESNENLVRLSNIEIEGWRSPSFSFICSTPTDSNQVAVNRYEYCSEQLESRSNSLEDLINKALALPTT